MFNLRTVVVFWTVSYLCSSIAKAQDCPTPPAADPNGGVTYPDTLVGSDATYTCNDGFSLVVSMNLTCQADGTWDPMTAPTCDPDDCNAPPTANSNGAVDAPVTTFGSVATYTCDTGYSPQGSTMLTCQAGGTWSPATAPTCDLVQCGPEPAANPNGAAGTPTSGTTFDSMVTYTCNVGFTLFGDATLTCQADGTWGSAPLCLVECGSPPTADPNGTVDALTTTIGSVATYTCNDGYDLVGNTTLTCQADGTWGGTAPTCDPVDCGPAPAADPNGAASAPTPDTTLGSTVTYTCDSGYTPATTTLTCQANGTWGSVPTCVLVDCGAPPAADSNGAVLALATTTFGSVATYTCNSGYNLVGSTTLTCQADETWGSAPTCVIVDCGPAPDADTNGAVDAPVTTFGAVATYTCDDDFDLVGSTTLTCQADGTWDGTAPTCDPIPEEETSGSKSKSNGKSNGKSKKKGKGRKGRALRTGMKRWALGGRE